MRTTTWYYLQRGDGQFQCIPQKQIRAFQAGRHALWADDDGFVRYAQLYVQWEHRRPSLLYGSEFLKFLVGSSGLFAQAEWAARVAHLLSDSHMDVSHLAGTNLIDASLRFAERRYRHLTTWQPSVRDLEVLTALVRQRLRKASRAGEEPPNFL